MGDLNTAAPLIKTVEFPGFVSPMISCNDLFFGCYLVNMEEEQFVVLFEKTALLDATTPPEENERNLIRLGATYHNLVDMNTTSLVFIQEVPRQKNQGQDYFYKKDFWIS